MNMFATNEARKLSRIGSLAIISGAMRARLDPLSFLVVSLAGWMNQHQQNVIAYLTEENRVLREQIGNRRMCFNDDQRRRLAAKALGSRPRREARAARAFDVARHRAAAKGSCSNPLGEPFRPNAVNAPRELRAARAAHS